MAADFLFHCLEQFAENQIPEWIFSSIGMENTNNPEQCSNQTIGNNFTRFGRLLYDAQVYLSYDLPVDIFLTRFIDSRSGYYQWIAQNTFVYEGIFKRLIAVSLGKATNTLFSSTSEAVGYEDFKNLSLAHYAYRSAKIFLEFGLVNDALVLIDSCTNRLELHANGDITQNFSFYVRTQLLYCEILCSKGDNTKGIEKARDTIQIAQQYDDKKKTRHRLLLAECFLTLSKSLPLHQEFDKNTEKTDALSQALELSTLRDGNGNIISLPTHAECLLGIAVITNAAPQHEKRLFHQEYLCYTFLAIDSYRELVQKDPIAFAPKLAVCLHQLCVFLIGFNEQNGSRRVLLEAIQIYRNLISLDALAHGPIFIEYINTYCHYFEINTEYLHQAKTTYLKIHEFSNHPSVLIFPKQLDVILKHAKESLHQEDIKKIESIYKEVCNASNHQIS